MSYYRIYPSKSNTIFIKNIGNTNQVEGTINTGQNTISEIMGGAAHSYFLTQFDLSTIKELLNNNNYICKLKLFDAGTLFKPALLPTNLSVYYFEEDFLEGDGFSFNSDGLKSVSNYQFRNNNSNWSNVFDDNDSVFITLNKANEDLTFDNLDVFIQRALTDEINPNFALTIPLNENINIDGQVRTKFIYTEKTRTIFKPYLEFIIEDDIIENRNNCIASLPCELFLQNENDIDFVGTLTCQIKDEDDNLIDTPIITKITDGKYKISFTPTIQLIDKYLTDNWFINNEPIFKGLIYVNSPNKVFTKNLIDNGALYFYPTSTITQPLVRKGDVLKLNIISEIKGEGSILSSDYEFKVVNTANFEMQPWLPVNLYGNQLYAIIDTSFYFAEMEYEVFVRLNSNGIKKTSNLTYSFKVIPDEATHIKNSNSSPWNKRK